MLPDDVDAFLRIDPTTLSAAELERYAAELEALLQRTRARREALLRISVRRASGAVISVTPPV